MIERGIRVKYTGSDTAAYVGKMGMVGERSSNKACYMQWDDLTIPAHGTVLYANLTVLPFALPATKDTNPKDAIGDTKVPLWLCSVIAKTEWALAQFAGMCKYGAWNWRESGVRSSVYLSAMERHLSAYLCGEELDPVDGTKHLGNIMACCAIILDAEAAGKLTDDRPPAINFRDNFKAAEAQMAKLREQYKDKHPHHHTIMDKK